MKYWFICICLAVSASLFTTGCSDDPVVNSTPDTTTFTYPTQNGNRWAYKKKFFYSNFRPDSVRRYADTGASSFGEIVILYDTVINSIPVKCFSDTGIDSTRLGPVIYSSRHYYANSDTGLLCHGYRSSGYGAGFPFDNDNDNEVKLRVKGEIYNSINELFYMQGGGGLLSFPGRGFSDTLITENPPVVVLKYPTVMGASWLFRSDPEIYKRYLGYELVTLPGGIYKSMKTRRDWSMFSTMELYDYYSNIGQIKRNYVIKDILFSTETHPEGIGYADAHEVIEVVSFNINTR